MNTEKLYRTVKTVTEYLVQEDYEALEKLSGGNSLSRADIIDAVSDYDAKIISIPEKGYEELDVIEVTNSDPTEWSVYVPIYTEEEGRSDLTLELSLTDTGSELYNIEIDNLHVL